MSDAATSRATWSVRLALLTIVVYFGGSLPAYKLASRSFGPATINLIRFAIASVVLVAVARRHLSGSGRRTLRRLLLLGAFGIGLMANLMAVGVDRGSATIASIVVGLEPIGVALAGVLLVGDRPRPSAFAALAIGFTGALVASGIFTERAGPSPVLPILLLLGTVTAFSLYTGFVRRTPTSVPPLAIAAITQLGGLGFVVPATLFDIAGDGMIRPPVSATSVLAVLFIGVGSAIAYLLLCLVLAHQPSSRVAVSMYLTPVFGVLFSWLIVREPMRWRNAAGGALVLLAVFVSERGSRAGSPSAAGA